MKKCITVLSVILMAVLLAFGAGAVSQCMPDENGRFEVSFSGTAYSDYAVFVIEGIHNEQTYIEALSALSPEEYIYFDIQMADSEGVVSFSEIIPSTYVDATAIISGVDLDAPVLAAHLYANGAKDEQSVRLTVDKQEFLVTGHLGALQQTSFEAVKLDSFGYMSYTDTQIQYSITPENKGVNIDTDSKTLSVSPFANEGSYTLKATVGQNSATAQIAVEREPSKPYQIKIYKSKDQNAQSVDSLWIDGVEGTFSPLYVYPKTFDQYGAEFQDTYTYYVDEQQLTLPFVPEKKGEYSLKVSSNENPEKFTVIPVEVTDRPRYTDGALSLFVAISKASDIDESIEKNIFISDKSGEDYYPDTLWVTKTSIDKLRTALNKAKEKLEMFDAGDLSQSKAQTEATTLEKAITSFNNSIKSGTRTDIKTISLNQQAAHIAMGKTLELEAIVTPAKNTDTLYWYSDNEEVARVSNKGVVSAVGEGTAKIYVETSTNLKAVCTVQVFVPITKLSINPSKPVIALGAEPLQLTYATLPETHSDKVVWSSANEDIASVDQNGLVTAYASGKVKITATTLTGKTANVTVQVGLAADKVVLSTIKSTSVAVGKTISLSAKAAREDGKKPISSDVVYSIVESIPETPGKTVAGIVPELGKVGGMSPGTVIVRVSAISAIGEVYQDIEIKVCIPATKITLNMTKAAMAVGGQDLQLSASMLPENNTDTVKWISSDEELATVDENGVVTAHKSGKVKITAQSGSGKKTTCTVSIGVPADTVEFSSLKSTSLAVGKNITLKAKASRSDGQKPISSEVIYEIVDGHEHAVINEKGKLVGVSTGKVTVRATAQATLNDAHDEVVINVCIPATKVTLNMTKASMVVGGQDLQLSAILSPENHSDTLTWSSADDKIATVDENGLVTAHKSGKVKITAQSGSGKKATCTVSIGVPADRVEFSALKSTSLAVNKYVTLSAKASRADGQKPISSEVIYEIVDGHEYATLDAKGKLTGIKAGTVTVRATAQATLNGAYDEVTIDVIIPITSIKFAQSKVKAVAGDEGIVQEPVILPESHTDEIAWSSSNEKVATVDENGFVTARAKGTAKIYAKSKSGKSAYYTLTVTLAE